ncbi:protein ABHD18 [Tanacetum coccineum]
MVTIKIGMLHYVLDHVYGAFMHRTKLSPQFFSRGWGGTKLDLFEKMINQIFPEVEGPKMIKPMWRTVWETKSACLKEGVFRTPCDEQIINALPPESHIARVAFLAPKYVPPHKMACVVHLAAEVREEGIIQLGGGHYEKNKDFVFDISMGLVQKSLKAQSEGSGKSGSFEESGRSDEGLML